MKKLLMLVGALAIVGFAGPASANWQAKVQTWTNAAKNADETKVGRKTIRDYKKNITKYKRAIKATGRAMQHNLNTFERRKFNKDGSVNAKFSAAQRKQVEQRMNNYFRKHGTPHAKKAASLDKKLTDRMVKLVDNGIGH